MLSVTAGPSRQAQPSVSSQISYSVDRTDPLTDVRSTQWRGQEEVGHVVGCLAVGAEPADEVRDRNAAHLRQSDRTLVLGADAAIRSRRVHGRTVRAQSVLRNRSRQARRRTRRGILRPPPRPPRPPGIAGHGLNMVTPGWPGVMSSSSNRWRRSFITWGEDAQDGTSCSLTNRRKSPTEIPSRPRRKTRWRTRSSLPSGAGCRACQRRSPSWVPGWRSPACPRGS